MTTGKNRKKVLIVGRMPQAGIDVLKKRDDVDYEILTDDTMPSLHPKLKDANAVTLGGTAFRQRFPADSQTAALIPAASTNVWTLEIDETQQRFIYDLQRDGRPRFRAEFDLRTPLPGTR